MVYNEKLFDFFIFARVFFALCNGKNKNKKMPLSVYYVWLARLKFYLMCNYSMTVIIRGRTGEFSCRRQHIKSKVRRLYTCF